MSTIFIMIAWFWIGWMTARIFSTRREIRLMREHTERLKQAMETIEAYQRIVTNLQAAHQENLNVLAKAAENKQ